MFLILSVNDSCVCEEEYSKSKKKKINLLLCLQKEKIFKIEEKINLLLVQSSLKFSYPLSLSRVFAIRLCVGKK